MRNHSRCDGTTKVTARPAMTEGDAAPAPDGLGDPAARPPEFSRVSVFVAVVRRCGPHLIEATVIPAVLFYACLMAAGLAAAYVAALAWSYAALGRRVLQRHPIPPILALGVIGITLRTVVAVISRSSFVYFFQPVLGTVAMGCVFLVSVWIGRPLIGRLATEFWPITTEMAECPAVLRLFRRLTLLWAAVNLASAALTMGLLMSLPLGAFLAVKQVSGLAVTAGAIFLTVSHSLTTARREGFASVPLRGRLPAPVADQLPSHLPAF